MAPRVPVLALAVVALLSGATAQESVENDFRHPYDAVIGSGSFEGSVVLEVRNPTSSTKDVWTNVSGSGSSFESGGDAISHTLNPGETKSFTVLYSASSDGFLTATTQDMDLGIFDRETLKVVSRDFPTGGERELPGIGLHAYLALALVSTLVYLSL